MGNLPPVPNRGPFKIWIWSKEDYAELVHDKVVFSHKDINMDNDIDMMVEKHNNIPTRLANYEDLPIEIPYPQGMALEHHSHIQTQVRELFSLSNDYGNMDLQKFTVHIVGVASRIFQSPFPLSSADTVLSQADRNTFDEEVAFLRERLVVLSSGSLPEDFKSKALELLENLKSCIIMFNNYDGKCNQAALLIGKNSNVKICILINSKQPLMQVAVEEKIIA